MYRFDFPAWLDPVLIAFGPLQITWYALAYIGGLTAGWLILRRRVAADGFGLKPQDIDDYLIYALLGVILGGRIGNFAFGWGGGGGFWEQLSLIFWPVQTNPDGSWTSCSRSPPDRRRGSGEPTRSSRRSRSDPDQRSPSPAPMLISEGGVPCSPFWTARFR